MKRNVVLLVLMGIATISLVTPAWAMDPPEFVLEWSTGEGPNDQPAGIGVDANGNVYVALADNDRIQKFTGDGTFILEWGTPGTGNGQFDWPRSPIPDASGNVFVSDTYNNRVQKSTSDGTYILQWGTLGTGDGQFYFPNGVFVDPVGNVYVTCGFHDSTPGYTRIQKFTGDGTFILKWGSFGNGNGQFYNPTGLAMDSDWNIYVADFRNNRIQKFTHDGTFLAKWDSYGSGNGQFNRPIEVAVDAFDNVYVADQKNNRIQVFSTDGTFLTKWGSYGSDEGQFHGPWDVTVDACGNIFVADHGNCRIQKFAFESVPFVTFDIKPRSCPNPLNVKPFEKPPKNAKSKKGGVLPVAILGTGCIDVTDIDVSTLLLEGVARLGHSYEDVAAPAENVEECECTTAGPDGYMDLTLKFEKAEIAATLGAVSTGDVIPLTLTGQLSDGTPFEASDCVTILAEKIEPMFSSDEVVLGPAVPNPFNPITRISYFLPNEDFVRLSVFDVTGRMVEQLVARTQPAGEHVVEWDAGQVTSGVYFYRIEVGGFADTRKMILLR